MGASGKVVSTSGATFVVAARMGGATTTTNVTVTTTKDTAWTQLAKTTAKSVAVGTCAFAIGKTASSGAVTATTLRLSKPTDGTCAAGFGGGRGGAGRGGQNPSGAPTNG